MSLRGCQPTARPPLRHLQRNVGELLGSSQLVKRRSNDLVFLLGAGATCFKGLILGHLDGTNILLGRLIGCIGRNPEYELVKDQHGYWRQILPVERCPGGQRSGEQVRQSNNDCMRIACCFLYFKKALGSRTTAGMPPFQKRLAVGSA